MILREKFEKTNIREVADVLYFNKYYALITDICTNNKYIFYLSILDKHYIYITISLPYNKLIIRKYDININLIDEPRRYDKELKEFKNQELMCNSTLLVLE